METSPSAILGAAVHQAVEDANSGKLRRSAASLRKVVERARGRPGTERVLAWAMRELVAVLATRHRTAAEALRVSREAENLFADQSDPEIREQLAATLIHAGRIYLGMKKIDKSLDELQKIVDKYSGEDEEVEVRGHVSEALHYQAEILQSFGVYAEALFRLARAEEIARTNPNHVVILASILLHRASMSRELIGQNLSAKVDDSEVDAATSLREFAKLLCALPGPSRPEHARQSFDKEFLPSHKRIAYRFSYTGYPGKGLPRRVKRELKASARKLHRKAKRIIRSGEPFLLFLRSFSSEAVFRRPEPGAPYLSGQAVHPMSQLLLEEISGGLLPVIQVGNPIDMFIGFRNPCPTLFLDPSIWQSAVGELIKQAQGIVAYVKEWEPGIAWEVMQIVMRRRRDRTVIVISDDPPDRELAMVTSDLQAAFPSTVLQSSLSRAELARIPWLAQAVRGDH